MARANMVVRAMICCLLEMDDPKDLIKEFIGCVMEGIFPGSFLHEKTILPFVECQ